LTRSSARAKVATAQRRAGRSPTAWWRDDLRLRRNDRLQAARATPAGSLDAHARGRTTKRRRHDPSQYRLAWAPRRLARPLIRGRRAGRRRTGCGQRFPPESRAHGRRAGRLAAARRGVVGSRVSSTPTTPIPRRGPQPGSETPPDGDRHRAEVHPTQLKSRQPTLPPLVGAGFRVHTRKEQRRSSEVRAVREVLAARLRCCASERGLRAQRSWKPEVAEGAGVDDHAIASIPARATARPARDALERYDCGDGPRIRAGSTARQPSLASRSFNGREPWAPSRRIPQPRRRRSPAQLTQSSL
jgi:hypothetical protein